MGILDPKSRVIDLLLTNEGKRQLVNGQMRVDYISYSDCSINYNDEEIEKIILEANNLPQDQITPEADANELIRKILTSNFKVINGNVYDLQSQPLSGSITSNFFDEITNSSLQNFNKLQIIKSQDSFYDIKNLSSNILSSSIRITNDDINQNNEVNKPNNSLSVDLMDSIFLDIDASKSKNYLYLPPIDDNNEPLYDYGFKKGANQILDDNKLNKRLSNKKKIDFKLNSSGKTHIQIFQSEENQISNLKKLDIIKYGDLFDAGVYKGVAYFVGRLLVDNSGNSTFYRIFTILIK
jgi:hypothetical protein